MFSSDSSANKKRGSVGTLTTPGTSTAPPSLSLFGTQPTTSAPLFGSQPTTSAPLFGSQTPTTSAPSFGQTSSAPLFAPLSGNQGTTTPANSLFGNSTSSAPATNSLFGNSTTSAPATNSLFGNQTTSTAPATNSLFGNQTTSTAPATNSLFGKQTTSTAPATNSLFGNQTTSTAPSTNSLFGPQSNTTTSNNSLFGTQSNATNSLLQNNQQQQQQQQEKAYLDLERCFPDKNVPYYVVTPDHITRRVVPANFFYGKNTQDISALTNTKDGLNVSEPFSASLGFNERNTTLPRYLTSSDNNNTATNNNKTTKNFTKKRVFEGEESGYSRNILAKNSAGVFSKKGNMTNGFDKNLAKQENQTPPAESIKDMGLTTSTTSAPCHKIDINAGNASYILYGDKNLPESKKTAVRVFGYDQNNIERIIKHFESLGELSRPYMSQGNWIIFDYVSPESALKAIQCNGMNIDQDHLVGVTWDEKSQEVEFLHYQNMNQSKDLFKRSDSFMNLSNQKKQKLDQKNQNIMSKIKEKIWGW